MANYDDELDDTENEDLGADASEADEPEAALQPSVPVQAPAMNPVVRQHLMDRQKQMADAQAQARNNRLYAGLARAGGFLTAGLAGSTAPVNQAPYNAMDASADAPVRDVQDQQKAEATDLQEQKNMSDLEQDKASHDPTSAKSRAAQALITKLYPNKFSPEELSQVSAADIGDSIMKPLELNQKIQDAKQARLDKQQDRADRDSDKADSKQDEAYTKMRKDMESFRGNQAAQQAAVKVQNADTALALVKNKDPNSLTTQDLNLLAEEMGKIATGGVPTEHGVQALMPNNLQTKFAEMKNFLLSKPTDAQAGEYIKHNLQYLEEMKSVAQNTINAYRTNIAKGYKNRVKEEDYNEALSDYNMGGPAGAVNAPQAPGNQAGDHSSRAAAILAKRQASGMANQAMQGIPGISAPLPPQGQGFAYGGMVGGLPASNYSAAQVHAPKAPAMHMPSPHHFAQGGMVPGQPQIQHNDPRNDVVPAQLSKGEMVLPLSVTQSKNPPMAAFLFVKHMMGQK